MFHLGRWLSMAMLPILVGGCATTGMETTGVAASNPDRGSYILLLSSSRSPTMESRFAALAEILNERATLEPTLEPYFAARQPTTVSGVQLVYGLVDGEFGVRQDPAIVSLLRREYPDLRWVELGP